MGSFTGTRDATGIRPCHPDCIVSAPHPGACRQSYGEPNSLDEEGDPVRPAMTILEEAQDAVYGARQADYGHPRDNFQQTADLWNAYFKGNEKPLIFTAEDVGVAMILVKVSRQSNAAKRDNLVDIAGYAATVDRVVSGQ